MNPSITVVVPTFRRPALLQRCLEALLAQDYTGEYEIIVVDDGGTDDTRTLVADTARGARLPVRYLRPTLAHGPAVARNCGWRAARGELIAFTDDDAVPAADWLSAGAAFMGGEPAASRYAAACGRVRVPVTEPPTDHERMTRGLETAAFVTANAFVWRIALVQVRGFDERFTRAWHEDSDLHFRLMRDVGPVGRCEAAIVLHPVRVEPWGVCLRQQKNAYFDALLYKKHPRLYRERIHRTPPWNYYAIVAAAVAALLFALRGAPEAAQVSVAAALALVGHFAFTRLRHTRHTPAHVAEMLVTSAVVPFLSVYWRLRGAFAFRVLFL